MKIIAGGRSSGKTTELVKISNKEWKYIICSDKSRVDNIVRTAEKLGLDIPFPITVDELPLNSRFIKSVLIDDIEDVLELIIRKNIDFSTTSCEIIKGDNIMNDCIWAYILGCEDCNNCNKYISMNSERGEELLETYEKDVQETLKPLKEKWEVVKNI